MKKSYLRLLYLPLAVVLSACSSDLASEQQNPIFGMTGDDEPVPVAFSVSAQHTGDFTRSTSSILTFTSGEAVKVCVSTDGGSNYTGYDFTAAATGQNVDLNAPSGNAAKPYFPPGSTSSVKAYAYYPATAASTFSVADNQTTPEGYKASDLMYAAVQTITKPTTSAALSMAHKMVQLNITASAQDGSGLVVKRVLVNGKKSVNFTPATGATTTTGTNGDIIAYSNGTGATTTSAQYILIPEQQISNVTIKIETGDEDVAATTATFAFTSTDEFEAGNSYPINLTVSTSQLGGTTTIANWNGQQPVSYVPTGDLTIEPISPVTFKDAAYTAADMSTLVVIKKNSTTLTYDTDYTLELLNNINAGTAVVVALGKAGSSYEGSVAVATFTINKADITPAVTMANWTYGNSASTPSVSGNSGSATVTYQYKVSTEADNTYTSTKPSDAGTYTVKAIIPETSNYNGATATANFTISKAACSVTLSASSLTIAVGNTGTFTVTRSGNGAITATSSSNSIATVTSVNQNTGVVTVSKAATGDATITVTVAASDNYNAYTGSDKKVTVSSGDPGVALTSITSSSTTYEGYYIAKNGKAYSTAALAASYGTAAVARITYVGSVPGYFDNFLAIALEDASSGSNIWYRQMSAANTWASSHAVTVGSTTYNSCSTSAYDQVTADASGTTSKPKSSGAVKGWRVPSVTDWKYIFDGIGGKTVDNSKVTNGILYSSGTDSGGSDGSHRALLNIWCGQTWNATTKPQAVQSDGYWSSSERAEGTTRAWNYHFDCSKFYTDDKPDEFNGDDGCVRAVFAY